MRQTFSDFNQQKSIQSENLKYQRKLEDVHKKLQFRFYRENGKMSSVSFKWVKSFSHL